MFSPAFLILMTTKTGENIWPTLYSIVENNKNLVPFSVNTAVYTLTHITSAIAIAF